MSRPLTQMRFSSADLDGVQDEYLTLSNGITLAGYIFSLAWIAGGPAWMALAGLVADEIDGTIARRTGTVSEFGSVMDFTTDMIMTALVAKRLGIFPVLPFITAGQVYRRIHQVDALPPFFGARSLLTMATVFKERKKSS
jgi:phosphatidylglycerophosphate synthase